MDAKAASSTKRVPPKIILKKVTKDAEPMIGAQDATIEGIAESAETTVNGKDTTPSSAQDTTPGSTPGATPVAAAGKRLAPAHENVQSVISADGGIYHPCHGYSTRNISIFDLFPGIVKRQSKRFSEAERVDFLLEQSEKPFCGVNGRPVGVDEAEMWLTALKYLFNDITLGQFDYMSEEMCFTVEQYMENHKRRKRFFTSIKKYGFLRVISEVSKKLPRKQVRIKMLEKKRMKEKNLQKAKTRAAQNCSPVILPPSANVPALPPVSSPYNTAQPQLPNIVMPQHSLHSLPVPPPISMGAMPITTRGPYICGAPTRKVLTALSPPCHEMDNMMGFDVNTLVSEIHREQHSMPEIPDSDLVTPPLPPPTSVESRHNGANSSNSTSSGSSKLAQFIDAQEFVPYKLAPGAGSGSEEFDGLDYYLFEDKGPGAEVVSHVTDMSKTEEMRRIDCLSAGKSDESNCTPPNTREVNTSDSGYEEDRKSGSADSGRSGRSNGSEKRELTEGPRVSLTDLGVEEIGADTEFVAKLPFKWASATHKESIWVDNPYAKPSTKYFLANDEQRPRRGITLVKYQ